MISRREAVTEMAWTLKPKCPTKGVMLGSELSKKG